VAHKGSVSPLSAVLVLWNARVHVYIINSSDKAANIETVVDECLGYQATLRIPYVNPKYHYIRFRGYFDNM